jgi:15-cis-phytoene desaturase
MQGAQYYLSEDIQITNGHIGFLQNPWALAAVSQTQFRPHLNLSNMGDGSVKGVLSVTISNWTTPGL